MKKHYHCKKYAPDWTKGCDTCGASPVVPATEMCGPCTWGEAETKEGNWEDIVTGRCEDCDGDCQETSLKSD